MKQNLPVVKHTLDHPDYAFLPEISSFLQYGMIGKSIVKKHLSWLHHMYVTPGTAKNKLDQLPKLDIGPAIQLQLDGLYKSAGANLLNNVNLITGFDQLLQYFIQDIQAGQRYIKNYQQQRRFVIQQLKVETLTHSFSFLIPPQDLDKKLWIDTTERLYQIIQRLFYLGEYGYGDVYFGFNPIRYTVLQPQLAKALHVRNYYKPLDNILSRTHTISLYGPKNILRYIIDVAKYLVEGPEYILQHAAGTLNKHPKLQHLFNQVMLPSENKKNLIKETGQHIQILKKLATQYHLQCRTDKGITEENNNVTHEL